MKLDAIRFSIGPWNGRYSSVWRVWRNPNSDDVYLGVRSLLRYLKISLHKTGKFRAAFVDSYYRTLMEERNWANIDRAFLKWEKIKYSETAIMEALDLHFPLSALSLSRIPEVENTRTMFIIKPSEDFVGTNDTITVKLLYHKLHPDESIFISALNKKKLIPAYYASLSENEYLSVVFGASKILPISLSKEEQKLYAGMCRKIFDESGKNVGDRIDDLTIQVFQMRRPPTVINVGCVSVYWESAKNFCIDVGM